MSNQEMKSEVRENGGNSGNNDLKKITGIKYFYFYQLHRKLHVFCQGKSDDGNVEKLKKESVI